MFLFFFLYFFFVRLIVVVSLHTRIHLKTNTSLHSHVTPHTHPRKMNLNTNINKTPKRIPILTHIFRHYWQLPTHVYKNHDVTKEIITPSILLYIYTGCEFWIYRSKLPAERLTTMCRRKVEQIVYLCAKFVKKSLFGSGNVIKVNNWNEKKKKMKRIEATRLGLSVIGWNEGNSENNTE